jgi:hypothetical protein
VKSTGLDVAQKAVDAGQGLRDVTDTVAETVRGSSGGAAQALQQTGAALASAALQLEPLAESAVRVAGELTEHTGETLAKVGERLPKLSVGV